MPDRFQWQSEPEPELKSVSIVDNKLQVTILNSEGQKKTYTSPKIGDMLQTLRTIYEDDFVFGVVAHELNADYNADIRAELRQIRGRVL